MPQYLPDHQRVFYGSENFHLAATVFTNLNVDLEHPLEALCPAHRNVAFAWRGFLLMRSTSSGRCGLGAAMAVGGKYAVVSGQVYPGLGHQ